MLRTMCSFAVNATRLSLVTFLLTALSCVENNEQKTAYDEPYSTEYETTDEEKYALRTLMASQLCSAESPYLITGEGEDACSKRMMAEILSCEEDGRVEIPETFGDSGQEFSDYAHDVIGCIEE